jgi:hypothetical protein
MDLNKFLNKPVLVRCYGAGVHFGTLLEKDGKEIRLGNARRLWSWTGAFSLSEVASKGVDVKNSKISAAVEEIILPEHIELLPLTSNLASL